MGLITAEQREQIRQARSDRIKLSMTPAARISGIERQRDRYMFESEERRKERKPIALTPRERLVLEGAAAGESAKVTAARLGNSIAAVKDQLGNARRKLEAQTTTHAVAIAFRRGLLT